MKRSGELKRKTPLKTHKPMARGTVYMRNRKPKSAKPKRAAREAQDKDLSDLCHGQQCFLRIDGICCTGPAVPCHSNQAVHGKGMGIKALHQYTVPGCRACHAEIDQGHRFSREERFAIWDAAFARWAPVRNDLLQSRV